MSNLILVALPEECLEAVSKAIDIACHVKKELTDEEIEQEWVKSCPDKFHTNLIGFARAILRKAQE